MPAQSPALTAQAAESLAKTGEDLRQRRRNLRISAVAAAEAAGISRVTLHRIEKGEASVTMGSYMAVSGVLGLAVQLRPRDEEPARMTPAHTGWIPARVRTADYPKLKELAWQVHGDAELTPREALDIYERNWRHLDPETLSAQEGDLVAALRLALGSDASV